MKNLTKKIFSLAAVFCAVVLSGCGSEENLPEHVTAVPTETTSLTLTEIMNEKDFLPFPEEAEIEKIDFVIFDPFSDRKKADASQTKEIKAAMEKISDAYGFLSPASFSVNSKYYNNYADKDTVLERDELENVNAPAHQFSYCPVNPEYASTEEELIHRMKEAFTENFCPDDHWNEVLFLSGNYKTIDGILCMRINYNTRNSYAISFENVTVVSCDGNSAEIMAEEEEDDGDGAYYYLWLEKSEEYGWRFDKIQFCYPEQASLIYNALYLKTDTLNKILDGGNSPANARKITVDDRSYIETDLDMTIAEMRKFFADTFENDYFTICDRYTEKYIDDVYYESEGVLYRDENADRWYLPQLKIDIFRENTNRVFYDEYRNRETEESIIIQKSGENGEYTKLLVASLLPVMRKEIPMHTEPYDPFPDAVKVSDEVYAEFERAIVETGDAMAFLYSNVTGFGIDSDYFETYADESRPMEENQQEEYVYYLLNPDYAETKEQLVQRIRAKLTEDFISDEEMEKMLFEEDGNGNAPEYKIIDGVLCFCYRYNGVMMRMSCKNFYVISYDGDSAEIITNGSSADGPYYVSLSLVRSEEYGWRLDSLSSEYYYLELCSAIYNGLYLRTGKLNDILGGGSVPQNPKTVTVNGEQYTERILDMSMEDMRNFFRDMFGKDAIKFGENGQWKEQYPLRDDYIQKYIDDVYFEQEGILYRRDSAPEMYLPQPIPDPYAKPVHSQSIYDHANLDSDDYISVMQKFMLEDGNIFSEEIVFRFKSLYSYLPGEGYEYINILSELLILERTK